jgi:hypothetical protein
MSKRRKAGEIVWKKANAGFIGQPSLVIIQPEAEDDAESCMLDCGDRDCREWATCLRCDATGKPLGGAACHVSECEMEDPLGRDETWQVHT